MGTPVFGLEAQAVKAYMAEAVNPELCQITEDLAFTEPYIDHPHNSYAPALADVVDKLRRDERLASGARPSSMHAGALAKLSSMATCTPGRRWSAPTLTASTPE